MDSVEVSTVCISPIANRVHDRFTVRHRGGGQSDLVCVRVDIGADPVTQQQQAALRGAKYPVHQCKDTVGDKLQP